jgi:pimeloyl-ACP methyl ester carboxylesterase
MILRVDGADIGYDDMGTGAAVVFLHGFPLDRTMWAPQTSALAGRYRCLAIDARGFGESSATPPFTMDRYADDVAAVLDAAGVDRACIVGLSMGGYVAFALWRRHAQRIRGLVLADTRATADAPDTRMRRLELIELARADGPDAVAERQIVGLLGKTTRERRPDIVAAIRATMGRAGVDGMVGALEAMLARPDSTPILPTICVPTLVIAGVEDVITPPKEAHALSRAIPGTRTEILDGAGHLSNFERPAAFNTVLGEFLHALESAEARPV